MLEKETFRLLQFQVAHIAPEVTHIDAIQIATIWWLELGNIKRLWKLIESEKITKILE